MDGDDLPSARKGFSGCPGFELCTKAELAALFRGGARVFKQVGASWMGQMSWWLGGSFKYFLFHPHLGKWSNLTTVVFLDWVETTN